MPDRPDDERDRFWRFVCERDAIWRRREDGLPEPWTDDPILREYHVTNVHRHKDPGTRWIMDHLARHRSSEPLDYLFCVYAYRSLNRLDTFRRFGLPASRDEVDAGTWLAKLEAWRGEGHPLGSKRHLTYFARLSKRLPELVHRYDLAEELWAAPDGIAAIRLLMGAHLDVGPFLGTQVVADLVTYGPPGLTMGRDTVVPVSGGSRFGLGLVADLLTPAERARHAYAERTPEGRRTRELKTPPREVAEMRRLLEEQPTTLSEPLTYIDLEHSLCEMARYWRIGQGDMTRRNYMLRDAS